MDRKFRFRAGLAEWQSRNAWPISASAARMPEANHGIVTVFGARAVSEILIVGCHHGWLGHIGYDRGGSSLPRFGRHLERRVFFGTDFALSRTLGR